MRNVVAGTCRHVRPDHLQDNAGAFLARPWDRAKLARVPVSAADQHRRRNGTPCGTRKRGTREKHPNELQRTWRVLGGTANARELSLISADVSTWGLGGLGLAGIDREFEERKERKIIAKCCRLWKKIEEVFFISFPSADEEGSMIEDSAFLKKGMEWKIWKMEIIYERIYSISIESLMTMIILRGWRIFWEFVWRSWKGKFEMCIDYYWFSDQRFTVFKNYQRNGKILIILALMKRLMLSIMDEKYIFYWNR